MMLLLFLNFPKCLAKDKLFGLVNVDQERLEVNTKFDRENESSRAVALANHAFHYYNEILV